MSKPRRVTQHAQTRCRQRISVPESVDDAALCRAIRMAAIAGLSNASLTCGGMARIPIGKHLPQTWGAPYSFCAIMSLGHLGGTIVTVF